MADIEYDDFDAGMSYEAEHVAMPHGRFQRFLNWTGALTSVALVAGVAVWGYKLAVRDVTGIPVVRALEGPMRISPEDPGGQIALHQGLSVNNVAAEGEAAPPPDRIVLAPEPISLTVEDLAPAPNSALNAAVLTDDSADTVAEQVALEVASAVVEDEMATADTGPVVSRSPRPPVRPAAPVKLEAIENVSASAEVSPDTLTVGTRLVQLGAFDDAAAARREWDKLQSRFGELMVGKSLVVQEAKSGGRSFFRLRAHGFSDESDARRFCSALLAENTACIPVMIR